MATIIEIDYYNAFWTKKIYTGPGIFLTPGGGTYAGGTMCYPGPVGFGDSVKGLGNIIAFTSQNDGGTPFPSDGPVPPALDKWPNTTSLTTSGGGGPLNPIHQQILTTNFYIEDSRIRGGYNNTQVNLGVRAYLNEENPQQKNRINSLIYSGPLNSLTNFNETNVFSIGESITKSVDPAYNSIQYLSADDTNLLIMQENKTSYALIDKDAIYSAEGSGTPVSTETEVIGQVVPYLGEYGISRNPESFARFGFQKYFVDKDRSAVMRLSRDGLTEISEYGMKDYFRDELELVTDEMRLDSTNNYTTFGSGGSLTGEYIFVTGSSQLVNAPPLGGLARFDNYSGDDRPYVINVVEVTGGWRVHLRGWPTVGGSKVAVPSTCYFQTKIKGRILGAYDIYGKQYTVSLQKNPATKNQINLEGLDDYQTIGFDESINGWVSRYTYKPWQAVSLENKFYTIGPDNRRYKLWQQYNDTVGRGDFYGQGVLPSAITFFANGEPSHSKVFQTISYEGSSGWYIANILSDEEGKDLVNNVWEEFTDQTNVVYSYIEGQYELNDPSKTGLNADPTVDTIIHAGFDRKENRYVANLVQKITQNDPTLGPPNDPPYYPVRPGEIISGSDMSGIKGFYSTITIATDNVTEVGGPKELFTVATKVVKSS